jgi:hypothetical protein
MLREHKGHGAPLKFYDAQTTSAISLEFGTYPYAPDTAVEYSEDGSSWTEYFSDMSLSLAPGDTLYFRASKDNREYFEASNEYSFGKFKITEACKCSGDVMSLLDRDMRANIAYQNVFADMFSGQPIITAPDISATEYRDGCFSSMFEGCTYLEETVRVLYAEDLAYECCMNMFKDCIAMTSTPDLRFKVTAQKSCQSMFEGCTSITKVVLRNTDLTKNCFKRMFYGCSSLNNIKCLFRKWPEYRQQYQSEEGNSARTDATLDWTYGVAPVGTFTRDYMLPLYINDEAASGTDSYSGETFNWDAVHGVDYNTSGMYHFDPWVGRESVNNTTIPECAVRYRTIKDDKSGFTATFKWLCNYSVTGSASGHIESSELRDLVDGSGSYSNADHAGLLSIDDLVEEEFTIEQNQSLWMTPDHDVCIDWGDGHRTLVPKLRQVNPESLYEETSYYEQGDIGGIFSHTYSTPGEGDTGQYIITVCSDNIDDDTAFKDKEQVTYTSGTESLEYIGCMLPLAALSGSNIEALLTPLLPIYRGNRSDGNCYPLCCMFYGNTQLVSVPESNSKITINGEDSVHGFMFYKNKKNFEHPFAAARMFDGCNSLAVTPSLFAADPNSSDELSPVAARNSSFEGFLRRCTDISEFSVPHSQLAPFMLAEFNDCNGLTSSLKQIDCNIEEWPDYSDYSIPDLTKTDCFSTYNWTRDVYDEYGSGGKFVNPNHDVCDRSSVSISGEDHEHEYNPWVKKSIPEDWFLTFTNNTNSVQTVTLKNQRRLFASLVNGQRVLNLKFNTGNSISPNANDNEITTKTVHNHAHLLEYRMSPSAGVWSSWMEITDDTLSNGIIHSGQYQSSLTSETGFDFVWSVTLQPGNAVQLRGVPGEYSRFWWTSSTEGHGSNQWEMSFSNTNFYGSVGDAGYWKSCRCNNMSYTSAWNDLTYTNKEAIPDSHDYTATVWRGQRMLTGINNRKMYYQFYGCNGLEVTGKIDTFFDWLDILSGAFTAPPYTYFRLFKGTGIVKAPDIFAWQGPDRGEFAECFMECTNLAAPALMNLSAKCAEPAIGPAPKTYFNYITMDTLPWIPGLDFEQAQNWNDNTESSAGGAVTADMVTSSFRNLGQGWYSFGNYITPHPSVAATSYENSCQGAFESMYKDCTSLQWPTESDHVQSVHIAMNLPLQLGIAFVHRGGRVQDRSRTMKEMFSGCKNIKTFGLYTYGKRTNDLDPERDSNLKWHCMHKMFYDCCDTSSDYLWNCMYTCVSLKHFSKYGESTVPGAGQINNGTPASWEGGGPYENWLGGTTNVAKMYTNCGQKPVNWGTNPISSVTRGNSHIGTCSNSAWQQAYNDHSSELSAYGVGSNYNKTLPLWNTQVYGDPMIVRHSLTWLADKDFTKGERPDWNPQ